MEKQAVTLALVTFWNVSACFLINGCGAANGSATLHPAYTVCWFDFFFFFPLRIMVIYLKYKLSCAAGIYLRERPEQRLFSVRAAGLRSVVTSGREVLLWDPSVSRRRSWLHHHSSHVWTCVALLWFAYTVTLSAFILRRQTILFAFRNDAEVPLAVSHGVVNRLMSTFHMLSPAAHCKLNALLWRYYFERPSHMLSTWEATEKGAGVSVKRNAKHLAGKTRLDRAALLLLIVAVITGCLDRE